MEKNLDFIQAVNEAATSIIGMGLCAGMSGFVQDEAAKYRASKGKTPLDWPGFEVATWEEIRKRERNG